MSLRRSEAVQALQHLTHMVVPYTSILIPSLTTLIALTSAFPTLPNLNLINSNFPSPWPRQPILCYTPYHAIHPPSFTDCEAIIRSQIADGPDPGRHIIFSRHPPVSNCPKIWFGPSVSCGVEVDVRYEAFEKASLTEIQATARAIMMKCVLGEDHLGGMTAIGVKGNMQVQVLGYGNSVDKAVDTA
ncbi:MAG: hypothetical protein Q9228_003938 [Teloschistes exilis]